MTWWLGLVSWFLTLSGFYVYYENTQRNYYRPAYRYGARLWFGINIGREVDIFSNPFVEPSLGDKISDKAGELYDDTRKAIDKELNH
ncbi:MAG: hypothetical protein HKM22_00615 [Gammaproteobacteria bacterium]|nr:hypothetical protein [Gammaproteobacteria bacterium]